MVAFLKTLRGFLILVALLLAIIPPALLVDLLTGGTGYGLCEAGLASCDTAFLTGPSLALRIFLGLLLITVGVRVISRIIGRAESRRRWDAVAAYYADFPEDPPSR